MLGKPEAGWTDFSIDDEHTYPLSYLTDVAVEWLEQAIHGLTTLEPFAVHGGCEPGRMVCTVSYWNCYIVFESDGLVNKNTCMEMYGVALSMIDFCKILYEEISRDLEDWVHWDDSAMQSRIGFDERRKMIQEKLAALKELLDSRQEYFGPHRCFF